MGSSFFQPSCCCCWEESEQDGRGGQSGLKRQAEAAAVAADAVASSFWWPRRLEIEAGAEAEAVSWARAEPIQTSPPGWTSSCRLHRTTPRGAAVVAAAVVVAGRPSPVKPPALEKEKLPRLQQQRESTARAGAWIPTRRAPSCSRSASDQTKPKSSRWYLVERFPSFCCQRRRCWLIKVYKQTDSSSNT